MPLDYPPAPQSATDCRGEAVVCNRRGLHARASARFVRRAEGFAATITVCRDGTCVPGTSIMGLMMLAATPGTRLSISATGPDAQRAVESLCLLIANRFDEE